ncbi:MAG TPA: pilus assembly protein TadG-related protein [Xanthobacteraceae bacterium]|nr:pilus assembly protein TadG-related protein [Xanthobacteraceae bacterium]
MTQLTRLKNLLKTLLRDQRGAVLIIVTVYLPVIVGFFTLAVDMSYVYRTRSLLQATADAAALAATMDGLPDAARACSTAKDSATKNMQKNNYTGATANVLKQNSADCSDVVIGMWTCAAGQTCSLANFVPDASSPCGIQCNAVKVTTRMASSNGNALTLAFASMIGWSTIDVPAVAVATYGGTGVPWNVTLLQDISPSFRQELASPTKLAQNADQALLDCMKQNAANGSTLGLDVFATSDLMYQSQLAVNGTTTTTTTTTHHGHTTTTTTTTNNNDTLASKINSIAVCNEFPFGGLGGGNGMPDCGSSSGSGNSGVTNIGGAIADATGVLCSGGTCPSTTTSTEAIVIVTDGEANSCGSSGCPSGQTPLTYAEAQAQAAGNKGIDVYTICYGCSTSDANWLAKLVKGNGFAMRAPTTDDIKLNMQKACSSGLKHRLVW